MGGVKARDVKGAMEAYMGVAADQLKKNGSFKMGGMLNLKLKKKPATPARKGVNPFSKEPCVGKAKPASKTVRVLAMKKLREAINKAGPERHHWRLRHHWRQFLSVLSCLFLELWWAVFFLFVPKACMCTKL